MKSNETTEKMLDDLNSIGFNRRMVEEELGYRKRYIDQVLSREVQNPTFVVKLERFYREKIESTATKDEKIAALSQTVRILTLELMQLKHLVTHESLTKIALEFESLMKSDT